MGISHSSSILIKRFTTKHLYALKEFFIDIASRNNKDYLDKEMFLRVFKLPGILGERLFYVFDSNRDDRIDLSEFLEGLSIIIHGSDNEKLGFLFKMYDLNNNGLISYSELSTILYSVVYGSRMFSYSIEESDGELDNEEIMHNEGEGFNKYIERILVDGFKINNKSITESLNFDEFSKLIDKNLFLLQILEDAFIFEDLSDTENSITEERAKPENFLLSLSRSDSALLFKAQNLKRIENHVYLGDIITPDSVKKRHELLAHCSKVKKGPSAKTLEKESGNQAGEVQKIKRESKREKKKPQTVQGKTKETKEKTERQIKQRQEGNEKKENLNENRTQNTRNKRDKKNKREKNKSETKREKNKKENRKNKRIAAKLDLKKDLQNMTNSADSEEMRIQGTLSASSNAVSVARPNSEPEEETLDVAAVDFVSRKCSPQQSFARSKTNSCLGDITESNDEVGQSDLSVGFCHSFEHMHHFHHNANYHGPVFKIGKKLNLMVARYFVLQDSFLYVFMKRDNLNPVSSIWMKGCKVRSVEVKEKKSCAFGIEISFPCDSDNSYTKVFFTQTKKEQQKWLRVLKVASDTEDFFSLYDLKEQIGVGYLSKVYVCEQKKTGKRYAVKIVKRNFMNEREKEALRLEISIMKLVHHPNVIQLRSIFETNDRVYLVSKLYQGGDLFEKIKSSYSIDEQTTKKVMWRLLDACRYIHNLGIVHRDIKPENIFLSNEFREITIGDFGLSDFFGPEYASTQPCGSLSYVAPEVFLGSGYGKEIDLWSLGVVMYVMLKGTLPFVGKSQTEIMNRALSQKIDFTHEIWKGISSEAKDLISKFLIVDPKKRINIKNAQEHGWFRNLTCECNKSL